MNSQKLIQERLKQKLTEAKVKNPRLSVRSFARQMKISPGTMSLVLLGKRNLSLATALKLADILELDAVERLSVKNELERERDVRAKAKSKTSPHEKNKSLGTTLRPNVYRIPDAQFDVMSEWYYYAILNLVQTDDFCMNPDWIAKRINLNPDVAKGALDALLRMNFITIEPSGKAKRTFQNIRTGEGNLNLSRRRANRQGLELAMESLDTKEFAEGDFSWMILPVNFKQVEEMKVTLRSYQRDFIDRYGLKTGANEVIRVGMQLFPLTTVRKNSKKT